MVVVVDVLRFVYVWEGFVPAASAVGVRGRPDRQDRGHLSAAAPCLGRGRKNQPQKPGLEVAISDHPLIENVI